MTEAATDAQDPAARAAAMLADDRETEAEKARMAHVQELGGRVIGQLKTVYDPEIPVDIYELGLVYKIDVQDDDSVDIEMTLTSPHCPVAETLPGEVETKVRSAEGVTDCRVQIVWDPPWHPSMMTEEAQLELGMIY